jgi:hypothetical protein
MHQIISPISTKKTPQTPTLQPTMVQGVIVERKRGVLDPLPSCNASGIGNKMVVDQQK